MQRDEKRLNSLHERDLWEEANLVVDERKQVEL